MFKLKLLCVKRNDKYILRIKSYDIALNIIKYLFLLAFFYFLMFYNEKSTIGVGKLNTRFNEYTLFEWFYFLIPCLLILPNIFNQIFKYIFRNNYIFDFNKKIILRGSKVLASFQEISEIKTDMFNEKKRIAFTLILKFKDKVLKIKDISSNKIFTQFLNKISEEIT